MQKDYIVTMVYTIITDAPSTALELALEQEPGKVIIEECDPFPLPEGFELVEDTLN